MDLEDDFRSPVVVPSLFPFFIPLSLFLLITDDSLLICFAFYIYVWGNISCALFILSSFGKKGTLVDLTVSEMANTGKAWTIWSMLKMV